MTPDGQQLSPAIGCFVGSRKLGGLKVKQNFFEIKLPARRQGIIKTTSGSYAR
jgi:hypothetical protein